MAKKDLVPLNKRTKDEQKKITSKGGIASGKSRRRKKALRTALKEAVSLTLKELPRDLRVAIMYAANITDMELTVSDAILGSLIRSACAGNSQMMKVLLDVLDETPDVRLKERELKLKERALKEDDKGGDAVDDVQIMMPEKEMDV
ncbi:hypothetical protein [uncultured Selenomonas sp.]|uniref:hypothetical protein n=1 Tax=uncultured Selenomonas sp. TaxID=159275 RepID=UPI0028DC89BC|nr:hypothetical protein [uncultured Selenomonas sp.]